MHAQKYCLLPFNIAWYNESGDRATPTVPISAYRWILGFSLLIISSVTPTVSQKMPLDYLTNIEVGDSLHLLVFADDIDYQGVAC